MILIHNQHILARAFSTNEKEEDPEKSEREHKVGIEMLEDVMVSNEM